MSPAGRDPETGWRSTVVGGRRMRRGFTTGTCAAAAAAAAAEMLFSGVALDRVGIDTPSGVSLCLPLESVSIGEGFAGCSVRKDAGDDPDITNGILVSAQARPSAGPGATIVAGKGIGRVTRPGLQVPVGEPAINPVPMKMIAAAAASKVPDGCGVEIELSIPEGERLARKTMNGRLGVVGGLSVLGTSGLVEPMSERSYEQALALELGAVRAGHRGPVALVTGNHGRALALERFKLPPDRVVKIGNLVGFALDRGCELGLNRVLLIGHVGKLIKVSAGIFNTHSRVADARFEIFAARAALLGAGRNTALRLREAATTEEMVDILEEAGGPGYYDLLAAEISGRVELFSHGEIRAGTILFNFRRGLIGQDKMASRLLGEF